MSSDMMIVCQEDDSTFNGKNSKDAFWIDECSMGDPWTEFGKWFGERYCKSASILEQLQGFEGHHWLTLTEPDYNSIKEALSTMKNDVDTNKLLIYIKEHIGKQISTENW